MLLSSFCEFTSQSTLSRTLSFNLWNFCIWMFKIRLERKEQMTFTHHPCSSISPPRGDSRRNFGSKMLIHSKCFYVSMRMNEYLVCKAKNSSNGNGKSNTHVSWWLQSYENAFHSNITSHGHSKNSLENKNVLLSKWFANFDITLKLWRMVAKFKPRLPQVSTHHCCSKIMKKMHAFKTPLSCHKWKF